MSITCTLETSTKCRCHIIPSFTKGIIQINHFFWQAAAKHSLPGPALQPTIERTQFRLAAFLPFADMSGRQRKAKVGLGRAGLSLGSELVLSVPSLSPSLLPLPCRRLPSMEGPIRSRRLDCGTKRFSSTAWACEEAKLKVVACALMRRIALD
jgi:hypothetical protein